MDSPVDETSMKFHKNKHIKFYVRCLQILPQTCEFLDSNRYIIFLQLELFSIFYILMKKYFFLLNRHYISRLNINSSRRFIMVMKVTE